MDFEVIERLIRLQLAKCVVLNLLIFGYYVKGRG
jgi:hypothetical protein